MFKRLAITNRHLVKGSLREQVERIFQAPVRPQALVLREKDLAGTEYFQLAQELLPLCQAFGVPLVIHNFWQVALALHCPLQVPLPVLRSKYLQEEREYFTVLGTSVHSLAEAQEAEALGATYLVAGHIFPTSCKPGLPPRGLAFLGEVCSQTQLPVYAIGGLKLHSQEQLAQVKACGAQGACIMSDYMQY